MLLCSLLIVHQYYKILNSHSGIALAYSSVAYTAVQQLDKTVISASQYNYSFNDWSSSIQKPFSQEASQNSRFTGGS